MWNFSLSRGKCIFFKVYLPWLLLKNKAELKSLYIYDLKLTAWLIQNKARIFMNILHSKYFHMDEADPVQGFFPGPFRIQILS